jgi:hypothetical protein
MWKWLKDTARSAVQCVNSFSITATIKKYAHLLFRILAPTYILLGRGTSSLGQGLFALSKIMKFFTGTENPPYALIFNLISLTANLTVTLIRNTLPIIFRFNPHLKPRTLRESHSAFFENDSVLNENSNPPTGLYKLIRVGIGRFAQVIVGISARISSVFVGLNAYLFTITLINFLENLTGLHFTSLKRSLFGGFLSSSNFSSFYFYNVARSDRNLKIFYECMRDGTFSIHKPAAFLTAIIAAFAMIPTSPFALYSTMHALQLILSEDAQQEEYIQELIYSISRLSAACALITMGSQQIPETYQKIRNLSFFKKIQSEVIHIEDGLIPQPEVPHGICVKVTPEIIEWVNIVASVIDATASTASGNFVGLTHQFDLTSQDIFNPHNPTALSLGTVSLVVAICSGVQSTIFSRAGGLETAQTVKEYLKKERNNGYQRILDQEPDSDKEAEKLNLPKSSSFQMSEIPSIRFFTQRDKIQLENETSNLLKLERKRISN